MIKILAIDPAASSGFAVAEIDGDNCVITEYGFIDVDTASLYVGDWCLDLERRIQALYDRVKPDEIAVEDYFFGQKFSSGANVNPAYRTVIHMFARRLGIHYEILNISNWKVFAAGRSTPTKEQKLKYGKVPSKKIMIIEALWKRWKIRFPNHSLSENTGKPVMFRYDVADAVAQAMYAAYLRYNCKNFTSTVSVPDDVVFKKLSKKNFIYES